MTIMPTYLPREHTVSYESPYRWLYYPTQAGIGTAGNMIKQRREL